MIEQVHQSNDHPVVGHIGAPRCRAGLLARAPWGLLLLVVAAVHLNLYAREDYDKIPTIGLLFLLTVISGVSLAVAVVLKPVGLIRASTGLFALSVLGGYVLSLTLPNGLFGFKEPGVSYSGYISIVTEATLIALSLFTLARGATRSRTSGSLATVA
jgi:hypothetical protein